MTMDLSFCSKTFLRLIILGKPMVRGRTAKKTVPRMMKKIITDSVASEFNWLGRGTKKAFKDLRVKQIIIGKSTKRKMPWLLHNFGYLLFVISNPQNPVSQI